MKVFKVKMVSKEVEVFFTNLIFQAIELREKNKVKRNDYLAYLIEMSKKKQLSELDIAAHGVTFFIGNLPVSSDFFSQIYFDIFLDGFDTSSIAMANALYEVSFSKLFLSLSPEAPISLPI